MPTPAPGGATESDVDPSRARSGAGPAAWWERRGTLIPATLSWPSRREPRPAPGAAAGAPRRARRGARVRPVVVPPLPSTATRGSSSPADPGTESPTSPTSAAPPRSAAPSAGGARATRTGPGRVAAVARFAAATRPVLARAVVEARQALPGGPRPFLPGHLPPAPPAVRLREAWRGRRTPRAADVGRFTADRLTALRHGLADRWASPVVRGGLLAVLGYLLVRAAGLIVLARWAERSGGDLYDLLSVRSDGSWFLGIARFGYDLGQGQSNLAFFPLYPGLVALAGQVFGWAAHPGLIVSWTASVLAALGLYAVGTRLHSPRTGLVLALLWGTLPHAVVETMGYSESLFTALAAWTVVALLSRRWLTAGLLCLAAGLARPSASALIPVVVLDAAWALGRGLWLGGGDRSVPGVLARFAPVAGPVLDRLRAVWRPLLAGLVAPLGLLGYLRWVGDRVDHRDGWAWVQAQGWGTTWDWGQDTLARAGTVLSGEPPLEMFVVTAAVWASVVLVVMTVLDRQPWQLILFALLSVAATVGSAGYYHSKARFLLTAFPLLLVLARPLARTGTARLVVVIAASAATSAWFGGYLLFVWQWSP